MSKVFIINGHQPYPFSPGRLNATLVERARELLDEYSSEPLFGFKDPRALLVLDGFGASHS